MQIEKINGLTGLRGLACLSVLIGHTPPSQLYWGFERDLRDLIHLFAVPNFAVITFYGLSAFLLTLNVMKNAENNSLDGATFYKKRILRTYPLYFLAIFIGVLISHQSKWVSNEFAYLITFTSNWSMALVNIHGHISQLPSSLAVLWSIAVEEQFYVLFVILLILLKISRRYFIYGLLITCIFGYIFRYLFIMIPTSPPLNIGEGGLYYSTFAYLDTFGLGALTAVIFHRHKNNKKFREMFDNSKIKIIYPCTLVISLYIWAGSIWPPYKISTVFTYGLVALALCPMFIFISISRGWFVKLLESRPAMHLGKISFSFYVWHVYSIIIVSQLVEHFISRVILATTLNIIIASISFKLIELPFLKIKTRIA